MIYEWLLALLSIPVGFLLAWLCRDELVAGRKYFRFLTVFGIAGSIGFCLSGYADVGWALGYLFVISGIAYWKSFDKKWTKKRR